MEQRLAALMRWNALAMVMRANRAESGGSAELGGHIASYASAADLFEVGFNHSSARATSRGTLGDLVFFQPHSRARRLRARLPRRAPRGRRPRPLPPGADRAGARRARPDARIRIRS